MHIKSKRFCNNIGTEMRHKLMLLHNKYMTICAFQKRKEQRKEKKIPLVCHVKKPLES